MTIQVEVTGREREAHGRRSRDDHTGGGDWERERGTWQGGERMMR
jgi:hypothetical protein